MMALYSALKKPKSSGGLYSEKLKKVEEKKQVKTQEKKQQYNRAMGDTDIKGTYTPGTYELSKSTQAEKKQAEKKETKPWYKQTGVDLLKSAITGIKEKQQMTPEERAKSDAEYRTKIGGQTAAYLTSRAEEGLYSFNQGLWNAAGVIAANTPLKFVPGAVETLKEPQTRFEREIQAGSKVNNPTNKVHQVAGDVISSTTRMIPSVLASFVNPTLGMASFAIPAGGQYAREAELEGATPEQQLAYGLAGGTAEAVIEKVAFLKPLSKILPDGLLSKVIKNGTANMRKNLLRIGLEAGKAALGEAVEEAVTDPITGLAKKAIYARDMPWFGEGGVVDLKEMGYDALIGGLTGGLFAAPNVPFNIAEAQVVKKYIEENYDATLAVAQGLPSTYKSSQMAYEYTKSRHPISYNELVELQEQTETDLKDYSAKVGKVENIAEVKEVVEKPVKKRTVAKDVAIIEAEKELQEAITTPRPEESNRIAEELRRITGDTRRAVSAAEPVSVPLPNETVQAQRIGQPTTTVAAGKQVSSSGVKADTAATTKAAETTQALTEQRDYLGISKETAAEIEAIEEEFFGQKLLKINLQLFAEKMQTAREKLLTEFKKEKEAIRWMAKEKQAAALEKLSQKYDAKIDRLNKLLDAEKYKNFWKSELDKQEFRQRIKKLRSEKNQQITEMKKQFSEKLKETKKQYTLKKHEAIGKLKHQIRDKVEAERLKAKERQEINKKLATLRKLDLNHMRPEYRKRIETIFDTFDVSAKTHTTKKLAELQRIKQYIEENPDHNIPDHVLKQLDILSKKTVSQISKEEFDSIYNAVMHLAHLEKLKNKLIMKERYHNAEEIADEASANILEGRKIKVDPTTIDTNKPEFSKNFAKEFFHNHLNPETICIMSEQRKNGILKKILFDDMYEGHSNELRYRHEAYEIFEGFLSKLDDKIRSWSRSFNKSLKDNDLVEVPIKKQQRQEVTKIRMTRAERLYLYLASKDADARRSMLTSGVSFGTNLSQVVKLSPEDLTTIENSLTADEKEFAKLAETYFLDFARPRMNEVFLDLNGYELIPQRKGYVPIKRHGDFLNRDYLKMRNKSVNVSLEGMGVLKERTKSSSPIVADDIFRVLVEHIEKVSAYYGLAKPLRNAKMLLENQKLKNSFRRAGMFNLHTQLSKYLQDVETKSVDLEFLDKLGYSIQNKFATSALGLNPFTILKQFSAYALETNEIPVKYLVKAQFTKTAFDEIKKYSPILAERAAGNISLELGEIGRVARIRRLFGNYKDIPELLTKGIVAADRQILGKTWNAVKMVIKEKNPSISESELLTRTARKTEEILRHTNSASTMYDRSAIARSKSLLTRALTMFTSQTNIMFNSTVRTILEYNQSEKTAKDFLKASKKLVTILVIANLMEQAVDRLRDKIKGKDDEESKWNIPMDIVEGILSQVYFVGKAFSAYRSKVKYGKFFGYDLSVPQLQLAEQVVDYATDLTNIVEQIATKEKYESGENKGKLKWKKTLQRLVDETFSILSKLKGLPYDSIKSIIEGIKEKAED